MKSIFIPGLAILLLSMAGCASAPAAQWWKGNLHTHSLWSDGDDFPEMVVGWYHDNDYDFIALSDHNILARVEKWVDVGRRPNGAAAFAAYRARFGDEWIVSEGADSTLRVRLKTLEEYRPLFEEPGAFLIIESEEISDRFEQKPIHINATNIGELIEPQGGESVLEVMQNNVDAVLEQRIRLERPMFPHLNHPNFGWAVTAEDLIALEGERFFEVYNGHPLVRNEGDSLRPGTERIWDIVLSQRLARGADVMYGLATDDAHNYFEMASNRANPGRGWVMVRAASLTPEALIDAMEAGDFYATTGVVLDDVRLDDGTFALDIRPEEGVTYTTQFIGTRRDFDRSSEPVAGAEGAVVSRRYSPEIGVVFAEVEGTAPRYRVRGDELYVRARVVSSKAKANPYREGERETAWVQPFAFQTESRSQR